MLVKSGKNISLILNLVFMLVMAWHFSFTVKAATLPERLSSDFISEFIENESIESVEEFIEALPPLHKRYFLLVFNSEAPNKDFVSEDYPRIISWGANARFILSWATNPDIPKYQSVEFLEQGSDRWTSGVIDFSSSPPEISNPTDCATCHGSFAKPLFGRQPFWQGTEEPDGFSDFTEDSPHVQPLRNAMASTDSRLAPLDFENSRLLIGYRREIKIAPGVFSYSATRGFYNMLVRRQAEILFNDFRRREQNNEIDFVQDFLCNEIRNPIGRTALELEFDKERLRRNFFPSQRADDLSGVQGSPQSNGGMPNYGNGDLRETLEFLYFYHLWQTDDRIKELYRSSLNSHLFWRKRPYQQYEKIFNFNNYGFGTATSEDELIHSYNIFFGYRGQNSTDARLKSLIYPPDRMGRIFEGHVLKARSYVCEALNEENGQKEFWVADSFASEAAEQIVFDIVLGQNNNPPAVVYYSTEDETATNGEDYTGMAGSISFMAGDKEKRLVIPLIHDNLNEDTETFLLKLTDAQGTTLDTARGSIKQSDANQLAVSFRKTSYSVAEGESAEVIVDIKGRNAGRSATIPLKKYHLESTSSDYSEIPDSFAFSTAETESSFTFTATDDSEDDNGESVELRFGSLPINVVVGSPATAKTMLNIVGSDSSGISENSAPSADAGDGGDFAVGSSVTLDGSGSTDSDGSITLYSWTQTEGDTVTLTNAGLGKVSFTAPPTDSTQTLGFLLTVEDDDGASDTDTVSIAVYRENSAPSADAGDGGDFAVGSSVTLDGSGSTDSDGSITLYSWTQTEGDTVTLTNAGLGKVSFTAPPTDSTQTLGFLLTVEDDDGASDTDTVSIAVYRENSPPNADAGDGGDFAVGSSVTLDGSGSTDSDGSITLYSWTQTEGDTVTLTNAGLGKVSFTAPPTDSTQTLGFLLTVEDDDGASDTDTVSIAVYRENSPPNADAGDGGDFAVGSSVTLDGSGSTDSDGSITLYSWTQTEGDTVTLTNAGLGKVSFTAPPTDSTQTLGFLLTVEDDDGAYDTDTVSIAVYRENSPPNADAGDGGDFAVGSSVTLDGSGSTDSDGSITLYSWTQTGGDSVTLTNAGLGKVVSFAAPPTDSTQTLGFLLTVEDDDGAYDTDTVSIAVYRENSPPNADAGDGGDFAVGSSVTLDGSGSTDSDGSITLYSWTQTGGDSVTLTNAGLGKVVSFAAPPTDSTQTLGFLLTVEDNDGAYDTDTVSIAVYPAPKSGGIIDPPVVPPRASNPSVPPVVSSPPVPPVVSNPPSQASSGGCTIALENTENPQKSSILNLLLLLLTLFPKALLKHPRRN